jgi:endonuclease III
VCDSSMRALNRSLIRQIEKQIEGSKELSVKARKLTALSGVGIRTAAVLLAQSCLDRDHAKTFDRVRSNPI